MPELVMMTGVGGNLRVTLIWGEYWPIEQTLRARTLKNWVLPFTSPVTVNLVPFTISTNFHSALPLTYV